MRKNCNFDHLISLFPFYNSLAVPVDRHRIPLMDVTTSIANHQDDVIISINGRILVCDMTELQARAIILLATRGEGERKNGGKGSDMELCSCLKSQLYGSPSLSMKRSLQRFLQKRKQRTRATPPYSQ